MSNNDALGQGGLLSTDYFASDRADALKLIRALLYFLTSLFSIIQLLFYADVKYNTLVTLLTFCCAIIVTAYVFESQRFRQTPISLILIFGFNFVSMTGALYVMTISGNSLVQFLLVPDVTFFNLAIVELTLIVTHAIYVRSPSLRNISFQLRERVLRPLKAFEVPSRHQFWVMGAIGCFAASLTKINSFATEKTFSGDDIGEKSIAGFTFLLAAPFLIPIIDALKARKDEQIQKPVFWSLLCYFLLIIVIGSMANARSLFADVVATVFLGFIFVFALGRIPLTKAVLIKFLGLIFVALVLLPVVTRIAVAIVLVRDMREYYDGFDLLTMSIETLFDSSKVASYAIDPKSLMLGDYSEFYIKNPLLARLIVTKFHDNMFYFSQSFLPEDTRLLWHNFVAQLIAFLPQPLINVFGLGVNKVDYLYSGGDYMFYLVTGHGLGGYRTGSMIAEGFALFGMAFPVVLSVIGLICFIVYDSFYDDGLLVKVPFSPIILLYVWFLFGGVAGAAFSSESIPKIFGALFRGVPQMIAIYFLILLILNFIARVRANEQ